MCSSNATSAYNSCLDCVVGGDVSSSTASTIQSVLSGESYLVILRVVGLVLMIRYASPIDATHVCSKAVSIASLITFVPKPTGNVDAIDNSAGSIASGGLLWTLVIAVGTVIGATAVVGC